MTTTKPYYVYTLAYSDGTVFYVGKGSGRRIEEHEDHARCYHRSPRCAVIRSIWRAGGTVVRSILLEVDDNREAYWAEERAICDHQSKYLTNARSHQKGLDEGSISQQQDGQWLAQIETYRMPNQFRQRSRLFAVKRDAEMWLIKLYDQSYFRLEAYLTTERESKNTYIVSNGH